jgi:hypothetical protein
MKVKFERFPWQKRELHWMNGYAKNKKHYGWRLDDNRFGGGWGIKFGIAYSAGTIVLDLIFGSIVIIWTSK